LNLRNQNGFLNIFKFKNNLLQNSCAKKYVKFSEYLVLRDINHRL